MAENAVELGGDENGPQSDELGLARLAAFSDAVFAIAITLLVLDIRLPELGGDSSDAALLNSLWSISDRFYSYLISFFVIGYYWTLHHRMYRYIARYNTSFIVLNLIMLLFIGFLPFPTSLIADYSNKVATIFYALAVALTGLAFTLMWRYASQDHRLLKPTVSDRANFLLSRGIASIPILLLFSAALALWNPLAARFIWILVSLAIIF